MAIGFVCGVHCHYTIPLCKPEFAKGHAGTGRKYLPCGFWHQVSRVLNKMPVPLFLGGARIGTGRRNHLLLLKAIGIFARVRSMSQNFDGGVLGGVEMEKCCTFIIQDKGRCLSLFIHRIHPISVSLINYTERKAVRLAKPCEPHQTPFYSTGKSVAIFA